MEVAIMNCDELYFKVFVHSYNFKRVTVIPVSPNLCDLYAQYPLFLCLDAANNLTCNLLRFGYAKLKCVMGDISLLFGNTLIFFFSIFMLQAFLDFRCSVIERRAKFKLSQAQDRKHIVEVC